MTATVYIVDDDASVRKMLSRLLTYAGYDAQCYGSAAEFLLTEHSDRLGCIILDICMPGPSGLELHEALTNGGNSLPVIFLTGHGDIPMCVRAMKRGAADFLTKPVERVTLIDAVARALLNDARHRLLTEDQRMLQARYKCLTGREREVFFHVVRGRLNKQIASELSISERTVKAHRAQVMAKMQVRSVADLVRMGERLRSQTQRLASSVDVSQQCCTDVQ